MARTINKVRITNDYAKELAERISGEFRKQIAEVENGNWTQREPKNASPLAGTSGRHFFKFQNGKKLVARSFTKSAAFGAGILLIDSTLARKTEYFSSDEKTKKHFNKLPPECSEVLLVSNLNIGINRIIKNLREYVPIEFIDEGPRAKKIPNATETPEEAEGRVKLHTTLARLDQGKFSEKIRNQYNHACVITGCNVRAALQAAHIKPFSEDRDDAPENGLLLRADLHLLFDRGLMAIHPKTGKVHFKNTGEHYNKYAQKIVDISKASRKNLTAHWHKFQNT